MARKGKRPTRSPRWIGAILLILLLGFALAWWVLKTPPPPETPLPAVQPPPKPKPPPEIPPETALKSITTVAKGKVAIVIDDMGQSYRAFERLAAIGVPMTFSVLPGLRYSRAIASKAHDREFEVMLHLPMEPENPIHDPGEGAIREEMTLADIHRQTREDLQAIPHAVGVNNHMGSLMTRNPEAMTAVLEEVQKDGLYFLDSKTTPQSVAYRIALDMGVPAAERQVFLDDLDDLDEIRKQVDILERIAARRGQAIAIGHPRPQTIQVLRERLPGMERKGYRLVFLSDLVK